MTYKGATAPEGGAAEPVVTIPGRATPAVAGEKLFRESPCLSCHAIAARARQARART